MALFVFFVVKHRGHVAEAAPVADASAAPPHVECAEGLEPVAADGCFARAKGEPEGATLLLYLHGRFQPGTPGEAQERERQKRVAKMATARGFDVLELRAALGGCAGDPQFKDWACWPSNERVADRGPSYVDAWQPAIAEADARGRHPRRVVFGFSSGAFFSALVALRGLYPADAFVVAHGGGVEPVKAQGEMPPLLLLSADDDISQGWMITLGDELDREGWPHDAYARGGGHELTEADIAVSLTFLERAAREHLPLDPPIAGLHRPQRKVIDDAGEPQDPEGNPVTRPPPAPPSLEAGTEPLPAPAEAGPTTPASASDVPPPPAVPPPETTATP